MSPVPRPPSRSAQPPETDGRRRRGQDSRARIITAMLELVGAGDVAPSAEQVAERAGVGLRTVFRHFSDMERLYREMAAVIEVEVRAHVETPFKAADWRGRVLELVGRRAAVYEKIAPFKRASDLQRIGSTFQEAGQARMVQISRQILARELTPELARDPVRFEALDLALSFEAWQRLRRDQGLSVRRAEEVVRATVRALLG